MNESVLARLKNARLDAPQVYRNITLFPMTGGTGDEPDYIALVEALAQRCLAVTEVSEGGSVPELKVRNSGTRPVLLLDGEELAGAKQNRVLNTTVLVPENKTIVIPVSCTEQGRWSLTSPEFHESGTVMARSIRARKTRSVSESLAERACYQSNQGEVWDGIAELQTSAGMASPTSAMRDVYDARRSSLDEALRAFPLIEGQAGFLVLVGTKAAGFDLLSRTDAFARLHGKLVRSYVMDALLRPDKAGRKAGAAAAKKAAGAFLEKAALCEEQVFPSVGRGSDFRYKGTRIAGSALVDSDTAVHTAFFDLDEEAAEGPMSGFHRRRAYRVY